MITAEMLTKAIEAGTDFVAEDPTWQEFPNTGLDSVGINGWFDLHKIAEALNAEVMLENERLVKLAFQDRRPPEIGDRAMPPDELARHIERNRWWTDGPTVLELDAWLAYADLPADAFLRRTVMALKSAHAYIVELKREAERTKRALRSIKAEIGNAED